MRTGYLFLPLLLLTGCFFKTYHPVREFDLVCQPLTAKQSYNLLEFRNNSTSGRRLQIRTSSGELKKDPYCLWALPPGELIPRAINSAMPSEGNAIDVAGNINRFEVDEKTQKMLLSGTFRVRGISHRFDIAIPLTHITPETIVQAAGKAADALAAEIVKVK